MAELDLFLIKLVSLFIQVRQRLSKIFLQYIVLKMFCIGILLLLIPFLLVCAVFCYHDEHLFLIDYRILLSQVDNAFLRPICKKKHAWLRSNFESRQRFHQVAPVIGKIFSLKCLRIFCFLSIAILNVNFLENPCLQ